MTTMMAKTQASESPTPAQVDAGVVQIFETDQEWKDDRLRKPNALVRILGWLVWPVVWEAMRQHPNIDYNREFDAPMLNFWDALTGRNRRRGFGP